MERRHLSTGDKRAASRSVKAGETAMAKRLRLATEHGRSRVGAYPIIHRAGRCANNNKEKRMLSIRIDVDIWQLALATAVLLNS
jgi:hypothetical protein